MHIIVNKPYMFQGKLLIILGYNEVGLPLLKFIVNFNINLINWNHYEYKSRMHHFIILQKYLIITSHVKYVWHYTCKSIIFMVQTLLIKPWPKVPHTMNLFVEDGLKNLVSVNLDGLVHGQYYYRNKNTEMDREILLMGMDTYSQIPFFGGLLYII